MNVRTIYLCETDPLTYHACMSAKTRGPEPFTRRRAFRRLSEPFKALA